MRRCILIGVIAGLVITGLVPAQAKRQSRSATSEYTLARGMVTMTGEANVSFGTQPHVFTARPGERSVTLSIEDSAGQAVRGRIQMDTNGDGELDVVKDFCSTTPKPIGLASARKLEVQVLMGTCEDGTPSIVTQGIITATFSR